MSLTLLAVCLFSSGCLGPDFERFAPGKDYEYSKQLLGKSPKGTWKWVRGRCVGDVDGKNGHSGKLEDEEVLLVTTQSGSRMAPGEIIDAYVYVCYRNQESGRRKLISKKLIYSNRMSPQELGARPENDFLLGDFTKFDNGIIELADLDGDSQMEILTSLWKKNDSISMTAMKMIKYNNRKLNVMLSTTAVQDNPEFRHSDIDKDGKEELIVPIKIFGRFKNTKISRPQWFGIYTSSKSGNYIQKNYLFENFYKKLKIDFYEDLAICEANSLNDDMLKNKFYLGLIYKYTEKEMLSNIFLKTVATSQSYYGLQAKKIIKATGKPNTGTTKTNKIEPEL
jgi:hypothetical protein